MRIRAVDERGESEWETLTPVVRVDFWTHERTHVFCVDVDGATVPEVIGWVEIEAAKRGADAEIAVKAIDAQGRPGLIWIVGDGASGPRS
jgi:hypothetical protein